MGQIQGNWLRNRIGGNVRLEIDFSKTGFHLQKSRF